MVPLDHPNVCVRSTHRNVFFVEMTVTFALYCFELPTPNPSLFLLLHMVARMRFHHYQERKKKKVYKMVGRMVPRDVSIIIVFDDGVGFLKYPLYII